MTTGRTMATRHRLALATILVLAGVPASASAQTPAGTLTGAVVDTAGKPVSDQVLTLHRVNSGGGAMVDTARTDVQGRFTVGVPAESDTTALFFVATRWQGQLYIGAPFRPPVPAGTYTVTVGVNPVQMGPASGAGGEPGGGMGGAAPAQPVAQPASTAATRWFLAIILGLVALVAIAYALLAALRERTQQRRRELMAAIAELDERTERAEPAEVSALERERAELVAQLTGD